MSDSKKSQQASRPTEASLDISRAEMQELSAGVTQLVTEYFSEVSNLPVFPETRGGDTMTKIGTTLPFAGAPLEELLDDCRTIIANSRHNGHPRFFGYVASPATPPGAFADLIASALNSNVTAWRSAPAATEVERTVVRWLGSMVGFGDRAHGLLTSGGSMANLTALLIAQRSRASGQTAHAGLWNAG